MEDRGIVTVQLLPSQELREPDDHSASPKNGLLFRANRSRSTMAEVYNKPADRMQVNPGAFMTRDTPSASDVGREEDDTNSEAEKRSQPKKSGAGRDGAGGGGTTGLASPAPKKASQIPAQIKLNVSTQVLLQIRGEDIPDDAFALKRPGERLELVINPVPDISSFGSASVFNMLGKEGAKQPSILYGTVSYIVDYLVAPHAGSQRANLTNNIANFIPSSIRRSSMNLFKDMADTRNVIKDNVPDWVVRLWDAFLLSYKDVYSTEDLVTEIISRFEKSVDLKPGASERPKSTSITRSRIFEQVSFETNDGNLVVARMEAPLEGEGEGDGEDGEEEEAKTSRSARAILTWMGLTEQYRSSIQIRTNTLLLLFHWLRSSSGALDVCASRIAFDSLYATCTEASGLEDVGLSNIAKLILKELQIIQGPCGFDLKKLETALGFDFDGVLTRQTADFDRLRIREMSLCLVARSLPSWFLSTAASLFRRNPSDVASELTLLTYDLVYRHIHPLMLVSDPVRHASSPVQDMVRLFRIASYWPLTCIFAEGLKVPDRIQRLHFFLAVADNLRKLCNFHFFFGMMGGLTQPTAAWLWSLVPAGDKAHKKFEELKRAISSYGDYRVYKADLSHCHGKSRIPFLGVTNRMLTAYESDAATCASHPHLYNFQRAIARSACINDFVAGQRHPFVAKSGTVYAVVAGPPGPAPYALNQHSGVVVGSKYAQNPPQNVHNGTYEQNKLSATSHLDFKVGAPPQVTIAPNFAGCVELPHNDELELLLAHHLSQTLTEDAVKEMSAEAKESADKVVVSNLTTAGFMY